MESNVEVKYHYRRNSQYFKTVTYKPSSVCTNTLSNTNKSSDLTMSGTNARASVLISTQDGTGWTFEQIMNKELVPNVNVSNTTLYSHEGFFIDNNNNAVYDEGTDEMITNDTVFTADAVVVPHIIPLFTPVTISFDVIGNGTIDTTGVSTNYTSLDTWADVNPKPTTNGVYYDLDGWYLNDIRVQDTDALVDGGVYKAKFVKDTSMQDELKKVLYTTLIDNQGNGVIKIRDLHSQYIYLVATTDGSIVKVKKNGSSQTMNFDHEDGICINTNYKLYEIKGLDLDYILDNYTNVSSIPADNISVATNCYVPCVIKNYTVSMDSTNYTSSNQNIAKVTISPTSTDYEYALYENGALVTGTEWQVGSNTGITFENIVAGKTYKVVTKDIVTGYITDSTGTVVYIDSPYSEQSSEYVLTIINGDSEGETSKLVQSGTTVSISTTDLDFTKWVSLNGIQEMY